MLLNFLGPYGSSIITDLPCMAKKLWGPFHSSDWLASLFWYTNTGKLIDKSCTDAVNDLLQVLNASLTCQDAVHFQTSSIAFCLAMARWVMDGDDASSSVILGYTPKTSKRKTSLLRPTELLMILKDIWNAKSGLMPRILLVIIESTCRRDPW